MLVLPDSLVFHLVRYFLFDWVCKNSFRILWDIFWTIWAFFFSFLLVLQKSYSLFQSPILQLPQNYFWDWQGTDFDMLDKDQDN